MKKLEECLLLLEKSGKKPIEWSDEILLDALSKSINYYQLACILYGRKNSSLDNVQKEKIKNQVEASESEELKEAYKKFIQTSNLKVRGLKYRDPETPLIKKLSLLDKVLKKLKTDENSFKMKNGRYNFSEILKRLTFYPLSHDAAETYFNSEASEEERKKFEEICAIFTSRSRGGFKHYIDIDDKEARISLLNTALEKAKEKKSFKVSDFAKIIHFVSIIKESGYAGFKELESFFNSDKVSNEEKCLFKQISVFFRKINPEEILNNELQKLLSVFNNKISIIQKGVSDTEDNGPKTGQELDFIIEFKDGDKYYNGKKISGIGIECNGEAWHTYKYFSNHKDKRYSQKSKTDSRKFNSEKYEILQWDEKDVYTNKRKKIDKDYEGDLEISAKDFVENKVKGVLNAVFMGTRSEYDSETYSRQMKDQRRAEIGKALNKKIKEPFIYKDLTINNLSHYFLKNKEFLTKDMEKKEEGKEKYNPWSEVLNKSFIPDDNWKQEIYKSVIENEKYLKANNIIRKDVNYLNNLSSKKINDKQKNKQLQYVPRIGSLSIKRNDNRKEKEWLNHEYYNIKEKVSELQKIIDKKKENKEPYDKEENELNKIKATSIFKMNELFEEIKKKNL